MEPWPIVCKGGKIRWVLHYGPVHEGQAFFIAEEAPDPFYRNYETFDAACAAVKKIEETEQLESIRQKFNEGLQDAGDAIAQMRGVQSEDSHEGKTLAERVNGLEENQPGILKGLHNGWIRTSELRERVEKLEEQVEKLEESDRLYDEWLTRITEAERKLAQDELPPYERRP